MHTCAEGTETDGRCSVERADSPIGGSAGLGAHLGLACYSCLLCEEWGGLFVVVRQVGGCLRDRPFTSTNLKHEGGKKNVETP